METPEVMSLEDMDPGLRAGQVWKWKSPLTGHESTYFLLDNVSQDYEIAWYVLDLNNGWTKYVYSVGQSTCWRRLV